ncbi:MAG: acetylglutamate kinase [Acidimicrobiia bacterium]|nr:acetylglutamate kinase [Acidimicrobiia bacterium]
MSTGHTAPMRPKQVIASTMAKAKIFQEAMPFIKAFRDQIVVIKYGGSAMVDENLRETFADDVAMLHLVGIKPIIVHGGGPQISRAMGQAGKEPVWVDGLRVTDAETLRVVQATLAGEINPDIVRLINSHGAVATGTTGLDANLFHVQPKDERLGYVGEITRVNPGLLHRLLDDGFVPVVAPLGRGDDGKSYNINADTAAGALAAGIGATKLVYLTDVEGLYADLGDEDSLISRIDVAGLRDILGSGKISAGMLPKLQSVVDAMEAGVRWSHILDGRVQHALLLEIFTPEGIGTMIYHEGAL